jgi:hypothetical protein
MTLRTQLRRTSAVFAGTAALAGGLLLVPGSAQAVDNGTWDVSPTSTGEGTATSREFFNYEVAPGATIEDSVTITNKSQAILRLQTWAGDAYNATGGGAYAINGIDVENTDVGSWITMSESEVTLEPEASVDVPFTMVVPDNATPGDHVGGIVTLNPVPEAGQAPDGAQLRVQNAVGVRLYARVNGPLTSELQITSLEVKKEGGIFGVTAPDQVVI